MRLQIQREGYSEAGGMGCFKQVRTKIVTSKWANSGMPSHTQCFPGEAQGWRGGLRDGKLPTAVRLS